MRRAISIARAMRGELDLAHRRRPKVDHVVIPGSVHQAFTIGRRAARDKRCLVNRRLRSAHALRDALRAAFTDPAAISRPI
jgi:enhancing lycopene biosynthesis protein 2